jgi:hypothetical protein
MVTLAHFEQESSASSVRRLTLDDPASDAGGEVAASLGSGSDSSPCANNSGEQLYTTDLRNGRMEDHILDLGKTGYGNNRGD